MGCYSFINLIPKVNNKQLFYDFIYILFFNSKIYKFITNIYCNWMLIIHLIKSMMETMFTKRIFVNIWFLLQSRNLCSQNQ